MTRRERFRQAAGYALYYGHGKSERLARFPVVIVEPAGQKPEHVQLMQAAGSVVLAYMSVMEAADHYDSFRFLSSEDFLPDTTGKPLRNEEFGTYVMDLRSKKWLGLLHHRIGQLLLRSGYDGIFLDTIGNAEMYSLPGAQRQHQLAAAAHFVQSLRKLFPDHVLVQNNGLNELIFKTALWIDGICWENPDFADPRSAPWADATAERLARLCDEYGLRALLLTERGAYKGNDRAELAGKAAERNGFLWYEAASQYIDLLE